MDSTAVRRFSATYLEGSGSTLNARIMYPRTDGPSRSLRFLQLNVQKRRNVEHSMMNDVNLKEYAALVTSEPYSLEMDGKVTTSPMEQSMLRW
jgi:hypothetical protein